MENNKIPKQIDLIEKLHLFLKVQNSNIKSDIESFDDSFPKLVKGIGKLLLADIDTNKNDPEYYTKERIEQRKKALDELDIDASIKYCFDHFSSGLIFERVNILDKLGIDTKIKHLYDIKQKINNNQNGYNELVDEEKTFIAKYFNTDLNNLKDIESKIDKEINNRLDKNLDWFIDELKMDELKSMADAFVKATKENLKFTPAEKIINEDGICHGLSVLWSYGKLVEDKKNLNPESYTKELDDINFMRNTIQSVIDWDAKLDWDLSSLDKIAKRNINILISNIRTYQSSLVELFDEETNRALAKQDNLENLIGKSRLIGQDQQRLYNQGLGLLESIGLDENQKEYQIRKINNIGSINKVVISSSELEEKLAKIITPEKIIIFGLYGKEGGHAVSIYKSRDEQLYYYDPNSGDKKVNNIKDIADCLEDSSKRLFDDCKIGLVQFDYKVYDFADTNNFTFNEEKLETTDESFINYINAHASSTIRNNILLQKYISNNSSKLLGLIKNNDKKTLEFVQNNEIMDGVDPKDNLEILQITYANELLNNSSAIKRLYDIGFNKKEVYDILQTPYIGNLEHDYAIDSLSNLIKAGANTKEIVDILKEGDIENDNDSGLFLLISDHQTSVLLEEGLSVKEVISIFKKDPYNATDFLISGTKKAEDLQKFLSKNRNAVEKLKDSNIPIGYLISAYIEDQSKMETFIENEMNINHLIEFHSNNKGNIEKIEGLEGIYGLMTRLYVENSFKATDFVKNKTGSLVDFISNNKDKIFNLEKLDIKVQTIVRAYANNSNKLQNFMRDDNKINELTNIINSRNNNKSLKSMNANSIFEIYIKNLEEERRKTQYNPTSVTKSIELNTNLVDLAKNLVSGKLSYNPGTQNSIQNTYKNSKKEKFTSI